MVFLTLIFVFLYAAALFGWLKPLTDVTMITRIEPIIFVIIGYYFGRFPAQQNERTLKEEINRQTAKTDFIQHAKEQIQRERETLEEKIKNAKTVLETSFTHTSPTFSSEDNLKAAASGDNKFTPNPVAAAAFNILNS